MARHKYRVYVAIDLGNHAVRPWLLSALQARLKETDPGPVRRNRDPGVVSSGQGFSPLSRGDRAASE